MVVFFPFRDNLQISIPYGRVSILNAVNHFLNELVIGKLMEVCHLEGQVEVLQALYRRLAKAQTSVTHNNYICNTCYKGNKCYIEIQKTTARQKPDSRNKKQKAKKPKTSQKDSS